MKNLDKRAHTAELIFGILIVFVINCLCIAYCKMYNKKKTEDRMQVQVNESVAQYFALSQNDESAISDGRKSTTSSRLESMQLQK